MQNWLLGGGLAVIMGVLGVLLRVSYKIGSDSKEVALGLARITQLESRLEKVLVHETRIGQLEKMYDSIHETLKEIHKERRQPSRPDWDREE